MTPHEAAEALRAPRVGEPSGRMAPESCSTPPLEVWQNTTQGFAT